MGTGISAREPGSWWLLFAAFAGCAPDLDFVPGLLTGDINRFHQLASHSVGAMALFGILAGAVGGRIVGNAWRIGVGAAVLYGSHLIIDLFTHDVRPPLGIPLFWPFHDGHFMAPWTPFGGVRHGVPGDPLTVFLSEVFSPHNAGVVALEAAVLGPIAAIAALIGRQRRRRSPNASDS